MQAWRHPGLRPPPCGAERAAVHAAPGSAASVRNVTPGFWPVRRGGFILKLYENSLSLALFLLFVISFILHASGGAREYNEQEIAHGGQAISVLQYVVTSKFWFESLQNWQSEFFSIAVLVVLSIFLRQKGSPESKPVDSPHSMTGHE